MCRLVNNTTCAYKYIAAIRPRLVYSDILVAVCVCVCVLRVGHSPA